MSDDDMATVGRPVPRSLTMPATPSASRHQMPVHKGPREQMDVPFAKKRPMVSEKTSFLCGLAAGVIQAGLFNPFDRALYLSVKHHRPFLTPANFVSPYQGFAQSVGGRALSGGLFYPLEHWFLARLPAQSGPWANFLAGTGAGTINALILNPMTAIKYKTWSRKEPTSMLRVAIDMYRKGGIRPFFNGLWPTLCRDVVFGGSYTYIRLELQYRLELSPEQRWIANVVAAALATIFSGPFNLARNVQYATKSRHIRPSIIEVFQTLANEVDRQRSLYHKFQHVQNRLRIGWGTARVAVGMAFGQYLYETFMWMAIDEEIQRLKLDPQPTRTPQLIQYRKTRMMEQAREHENRK